MKSERRITKRKEVHPLKISSITLMDSLIKLVREATVINASAQGLLMHVKREFLIPKSLKSTLSLDSLLGETVVIKISEMELELSGKIARTRLLGKKGFELAIDYSSDSPQYWRECLMDLLPSPEEFSEIQKGEGKVIQLKNYKSNR